MSFRWFIYYCALFGGWAALLGWALGRALAPDTPLLLQTGVKGLFLGFLVALAVGLVDALWSLSLRQAGQVAFRAGAAVLVGCLGGLLGGVLGQALYGWTKLSVFLVLGWTITGLLIGVSVGAFEVLAGMARKEDLAGARRKLVNGFLGGAVGGLLGGVLFLLLKLWPSQAQEERLWSPGAVGFVALGLCIGLLIGLAQVVLREAWVRVEAGFRAGRDLLLSKSETTIGRSESCDIGLFGDPGVEPRHAHIRLQGGRYVLVDAGSPGGTFLHEARITRPAALRSGDLIRVGRSVLRFGERARREAPDEN